MPRSTADPVSASSAPGLVDIVRPAGTSASWRTALALLAAAATVLLTWYRIHLGVDLTDESFYIALPYRFVQGDVPLRDEQNLAQLAALLSVPLVRLSLWVHSGSDGLVLFMRHMHLLFTLLVGAVVFRSARRLAQAPDALVLACLCVAFVPFNIHGLSYNTVACGLLTMGLFLAFAAAGDSRLAPLTWTLAGVCHAGAALVYPTLCAGLLAVMALGLAGLPQERRRATSIAYGAGVLLVGLVPGWLVLQAGWASVPAIGGYLSSFHAQGGGGSKFVVIGKDFLADTPRRWWVLAVLVTLLACRWLPWRGLRPVAAAVPVLVLLALLCQGANGTASLYLVAVLAVLAPFLAPLAGRSDGVRQLMYFVWLPALACAVVTAWSSSNGAVNASLGAFPAAIAAVLLLQHTLARTQGPLGIAAKAASLAAPILASAALLLGGFADYYGEKVQLAGLTEKVANGPFRGLVTTPAKRDQLLEVETRLVPMVREGDRAVVFDRLPGGYLLLGARAGVNSIWLPPATPVADRSSTLAYWKSRGMPTLALIVPEAERANDPLVTELAAAGFAEVAKVELGTLWRGPARAGQDNSRR